MIVTVSTHEIRAALDTVLDERERWNVEHAFGLHGTPPHTLKEMGETLGISPERVRQLRARALTKLRRHLTAAR
jgi:DNA-directed RNA polymerase sigma subunit (sigma70/sigma32)